jgi:two-component system sensor histidine kinase MprB
VVADAVTVRGRRAQLDRAITNLLGNAAKFSPATTTIEVSVTGGRVAVRDHGAGIAAADRNRLFERFYRADSARSTPGSGLGLAIVEQVARAHDGSVFVDDAPGGGTVVGFTLPV